MLFLEFLWIFVFIVFLNARPIFKSIANNFDEKNIPMPHNVDLIKRNLYYILNSDEKHIDRYGIKNIPIRENKNNPIIRRKIACKKSNDFDKYELPKYYEKYGDLHTDKEITKYNTREIFKSTKTDALQKEYNIEIISTTPSLLDIRILENSNNVFGLLSPKLSSENSEFLGTAEIEAVLNEIKHRERQIIAGHEPILSNLITNTIIQTTFSSILDLKSYSNENKHPSLIKETKNKLLNHLFQRSIKEECSTLAESIENKFQKKIKNVFKRVKNKLSHDLDKEIKSTKAASKQKFEQITKKICNSTKTPNEDLKHIQPTKFTQNHPHPVKYPSNATVANTRNTCRTIKFKPLQKNKSTSSTTSKHTISTLGDEFSILTIIEQLLSKGQENSVLNEFTTMKNSVKKVERSPRLNQNNSSNDQEIYFNVQEYPNTNLDIENKIHFLETQTTNGHEQDADETTENTSFEALINKLSYNDYVNGYKYYLNYQKKQDDNKFSNLIRYQAHKHHNVDDIGKFILNKIPQLPTKIYKRHFVESETLEDQDLSTKSEDSWFKRHFFIYVDTDPPKQFHSTQTVTCKNNILQNDNNCGLRNKTYYNMKKRDNWNKIRNRRHSHMFYNNKINSPFIKDVTSHTRSTVTIMLQKEKDKKRLGSFQVFHCKPNLKHKREDRFRTQRFDILKGIKDSFKYRPKYSRIRQEKMFNYEIRSSPQQHDHFNVNNLYQAHEMLKQVPNISENFEFSFPVLDSKYNILNEYSLKYTNDNSQELHFQTKPYDKQKAIVDCAQRSFWISTGKQNELNPFKVTSPISSESENNRDIQINYVDLINEHLKTDLSQEHFEVPVTRSTTDKNVEIYGINSNYGTKLILPKFQKPNNMNSIIHLDNIMLNKSDPLFNIKVGSIPLKESDLAERVTEMYYNNLITTDSIHKLHEKDIQFKNNYKKSSNTFLCNDHKFVGNIKSTTNSVVNKVNKSNLKDTSPNTGGRPYTMNKNYNSNMTFLKSFEVQPKQYFMTPLPMKMEDFNKFLKDHEIDVESVTAPLKHPLPFNASIIDKWKLNKRTSQKH